ncbi:unnamed protein product [Calicophoron daubneyi]|uniref:Non-lysosomal glucosylceramidase n=1 Tax=Calicophoron daubneyi TaxID=300641 RepID=A0AAV2TBN0_CALDB
MDADGPSEVQSKIEGQLVKLGLISKYGWRARFNFKPEFHCKPFNIPRLSQLKKLLPMALRYTLRYYLRKRFVEHRLPFLDPSSHVPWNPIYGVPMGGIGCGAIGRGFRGEFIRSSLIPGMYCYEPQPADQFILTVRKDNHTLYQQVLSPFDGPPTQDTELHHWMWGFPVKNGLYIGLYPRSWTIYEIPEVNIVLVCEQISPVLPNNYKTTCLPVCVLHWHVLNFGKDAVDVSLTFSWHGPSPSPRDPQFTVSGDPTNRKPGGMFCSRAYATEMPKSVLESVSSDYLIRSAPFESSGSKIRGCFLERFIGNELPCCFGIAARSTDSVSVRRCPGFLFNKQILKQRQNSKGKSQSAVYGSPVDGDCLDHLEAFQSFKMAPSARDIWRQLYSADGLDDSDSAGFTVESHPALQKRPPKLAVAVCATCTVPSGNFNASGECENPGQSEIEFAITWHSPVVRFRSGDVVYTRRYVRWFPEPGMRGAMRLLEHALTDWRRWVVNIDRWQNPILNNPSLPNWYKSALFNELYYLTDGGTIWVDPVEVQGIRTSLSDGVPLDAVRCYRSQYTMDPLHLTGRHLVDGSASSTNAQLTSLEHRRELGQEIGLFGYLEGHEYRMYNTVDVHFYASWALIKLWPKIQLAINYDCADLAIAEDSSPCYYIHEGRYAIRSCECAVPHDFGDPENEPWRQINAYIMYPTDNWKDLNVKFILQAWRDWKLTQDYNYLLYMLPIVCRMIRVGLNAWDGDGDGVIENSGFPDQTYDTWTAEGMTAYTGGLWVASVYAAHDMLKHGLSETSPIRSFLETSLDDQGTPWTLVEQHLRSLVSQAKNSYDQALWRGFYYAYQSAESGSHHSVMADQLCGYWFLRVAGAPEDAILPRSHVQQALKTIQQYNWLEIQGGSMGLVNGSLPEHRIDRSSCQSEEFWVGVNYAVASTMVADDMIEEGLSLAGACYNTVYNRFGLQYQTPEAYTLDGRFRSLGYMRPLAIWSIQQALEMKQAYKFAVACGDSVPASPLPGHVTPVTDTLTTHF